MLKYKVVWIGQMNGTKITEELDKAVLEGYRLVAVSNNYMFLEK